MLINNDAVQANGETKMRALTAAEIKENRCDKAGNGFFGASISYADHKEKFNVTWTAGYKLNGFSLEKINDEEWKKISLEDRFKIAEGIFFKTHKEAKKFHSKLIKENKLKREFQVLPFRMTPQKLFHQIKKNEKQAKEIIENGYEFEEYFL